MAEYTIIDLLRHGHCEGGDIYRGSSDVSLSDVGWQQMCVSSAKFSADWQAIISSPMQRCVNFAGELAQNLELEHVTESDLRETHFGQWEGQLVQDVWENDRKRVQAWMNDPMKHAPPGGEATDEFINRVERLFKQVSQRLRGKHCVLVTHGGVIRVILSHVTGGTVSSLNRFEVPYANVSRIRIWHSDRGDFPQLVFHNPVGCS
ncbi:MAG: histidine phosphatase family protein [Pseudomonadota bacterium]